MTEKRFSNWRPLLVCLAPWLAFALTAFGAGRGDEVIVIYNSSVPASKAVAEYYAEKRQVPENHVFGFKLSTGAEMSREEFKSALQDPLAKALNERELWKIRAQMITDTNGRPKIEWKVRESKIRYAVVCYGVPWRITRDPTIKERAAETMRPEFRDRNEASVDNDLALLPSLEQHLPLTGVLSNPLFGATNSAAFYPSNGVLLVTRLDGPTDAIARGLVDKAIDAETNGMWGRAYIDIRSIPDPNYKFGDEWLRTTAEICRRLGFETVVDTNSATFPVEFPMSQIGFYAGWYDFHASGPFARSSVEFMPGAFAYHLHSFSAADIRSETKNWVGPFLSKGVTITMGSVAEPYLGGTPDMGVFAARLLYFGLTFGEAAYASQGVLSWQTVAIGDPLYQPFGIPAQQLHERLLLDKDPRIEWSYLRLMNMNLARGVSMIQIASQLNALPQTEKSAVLTEKLGDLYLALGKPSSATEMWERALTLEPSPLQRVRLRLVLANQMQALDRPDDAMDHLNRLLEESPGYPAREDVYKRLAALARKAGKEEAAVEYEKKAAPATPAPAS